jgi:hypothetical protein
VLAAADLVLLVLRPTLMSMRAAAVALVSLSATGRPPVGLVLVGDRPYSAREVEDQLGVPVVVALPEDAGTATVLSTGGEHHRGRLLRAAARAEPAVWQLIASEQTRAHPDAGTVSGVR